MVSIQISEIGASERPSEAFTVKTDDESEVKKLASDNSGTSTVVERVAESYKTV